MGIGEALYGVLNRFFPETFPLTPSPTPAQIEESANQACFEDIYSEPCARLSDLSEQNGGINIRKEMMDLDARIRPMLNRFLAEHSPEVETCTQLVESTESDPGALEVQTSARQVCEAAPERACYEMLQCTQSPFDATDQSLQIYLIVSPNTTHRL